MDIAINGRTAGEYFPSYRVTICADHGNVSLRFDDDNNPEFWIAATIPRSTLIEVLGSRTAHFRHRIDPRTGEPDEYSGVEVSDPRQPGMTLDELLIRSLALNPQD